MSTFIYALADPITGDYRYIGKADNPVDRYARHLRPYMLNRRNHKTAWIRNLLSRNLKPILVILAKVAYSQWQEMERDTIARAKARGYKLTNSTSGGDGSMDLIISEESKRKMSESHKKIKITDEWRRNMSLAQKGKPRKRQYLKGELNPWRGKHHSEETKAKMSLAKKGKPNPKLAIALKGKFGGEHNPFYGKHHTEEERLRMSVSQRLRRIREQKGKRK